VVAVQRMNACCPKKDPATASRPDLGERWPSRLVATAAENRLSTFRATLTRRCGSQRLPNNRTCTRAPPGAVRGSHPGTSNDRSEGERPQSWARQLKRIASQMPSGIVARNCFQLGGAGYAAARDQPGVSTNAVYAKALCITWLSQIRRHATGNNDAGRVLRPTANFSWLVIKLRRGVIRDKSRKK
jgi:hypothetical protein